MADQPVFLVEREGNLGGNMARTDLTASPDPARDLLTDRITRVAAPGISVLANCS